MGVLFRQVSDEIDTISGLRRLVRRVLSVVKEEVALEYVSHFPINLLQGVCAAMELDDTSKRLPYVIKGHICDLLRAIDNDEPLSSKIFNSLIFRAHRHLIEDDPLMLPRSNVKEEELPPIPASKGLTTAVVEGTTMVPSNLEEYREILAEYTGRPVEVS